MSTHTDEQTKQARAHVAELITTCETPPQIWHFNYAPLVDTLYIHLFYKSDAVFQQVRASGEGETLIKCFRTDLKSTCAFLEDRPVSIVLDSIEEVGRMGGWLNYYK